MGRPKGSRNKPKLQEHPEPKRQPAEKPAQAGPGHNSALTDEEQKALHYGHHVPAYEAALAAKKEADAELKNVCKRIKAEGGSVEGVKRTIALRSDEGVAKLKAEIEAMLRIARWDGVPVQASLFDEVDRTPTTEKAYEQGKTAGMSGADRRPPYDAAGPQAQEWLRGYADGRATAASAIKKLQPEPTPVEQAAAGEPAAGDDQFSDALDDVNFDEDGEPVSHEERDGRWPDGDDIPPSLDRRGESAQRETEAVE